MYAVKSELTFGSIFILLLLCSETVGEDQGRRIRGETGGSVYCDEARNNHSASDLLR